MSVYPTPHINAAPGDFAPTVLMPGDPKRSLFVAQNFLCNAVLVNDVRGVQGYTGTYKGKRVSVMASGMGMPSIGIYSHELFNFFGVENIIRIGSMGALADDVELRDVVFCLASSTDSNFLDQFELPGTFAPAADFELLRSACLAAEKLGVKYRVGNVLSSDRFYNDDPSSNAKWLKMGVLGVEMECAALYANAARASKHALGIFTVSDHIIKGTSLDAEARQSTFTDMIETALEIA
jgi:purine-nucleoside phosphorylase